MACIQTPPGTKSRKKKKKDKKNAERSSLPTSFNPKKKKGNKVSESKKKERVSH